MITDQQALYNKIVAQSEGLSAWVGNHCKGTFAWATGVGKSRGALLCLEYVRSMFPIAKPPRVLLVVPTEEMRDTDWPDEFSKWTISDANVKCVCYASLAKEVLSNYDFIIYDECHRLTVHNLQKLVHFTGMTLGLTATFPKVKYEDSLERVNLITDLLPPVHTIKTDEAVELGLVSDFEIFVLKFLLDGVHFNIQGGTKRRPKMVTEQMHYKKLTQNLQSAMIKNIEAMKFAAISKRVQFLYNLPSRLRLSKKVMGKLMEDNKRTLVLCGSIEQATILCGKDVCHSQTDRSALLRFQAGEINLIGAVKQLNEGKNLNNLEQELINQIDSVERNLTQRIGRAIRRRPNRPDFKARIVILVAMNTADEKWYKSSIANFESSRIKETIIIVPDVDK